MSTEHALPRGLDTLAVHSQHTLLADHDALFAAAAGLIPVIGMAAPIVIYMRAFFHPLRKGWHDQAAGTIVVKR